MAKCTVCGKEGHGPERHGLPEEWSKEDQRTYARAARLYSSLSEDEVCFIVTQFDAKNGLKDWRTRLTEKEQGPLRARVRNFWVSVGVILGLIVLVVLNNDYSDAKHKRNKLEYTYARRSENSALNEGLKWIDDELAALAASIDE